MFFHKPFGGMIPGPRGDVLATLLRTGSPLTGRQVHTLVSERCSLWTVQQALKDLTQLGIITTETVGRAGVHTVNEKHVAVGPARALLDPLTLLAEVVHDSVGHHVHAVVLFGSVARGDSGPASDVDLAVVAPPSWAQRVDLEDAVHNRLGNHCEVLHLTSEDWNAAEPEPVVAEIRREGVTLYGSTPPPAVGSHS